MCTAKDIRKLRAELKLTRPKFASLVGVDFRTLIRWETGACEPKGAGLAVLVGLQVALERDTTGRVHRQLCEAAEIGGLTYLLISLLTYRKR